MDADRMVLFGNNGHTMYGCRLVARNTNTIETEGSMGDDICNDAKIPCIVVLFLPENPPTNWSHETSWRCRLPAYLAGRQVPCQTCVFRKQTKPNDGCRLQNQISRYPGAHQNGAVVDGRVTGVYLVTLVSVQKKRLTLADVFINIPLVGACPMPTGEAGERMEASSTWSANLNVTKACCRLLHKVVFIFLNIPLGTWSQSVYG